MNLKRLFLRYSLKTQKQLIRLKNLELEDFHSLYIFASKNLYRIIHLRNLVIFCIVFVVVVTLMFFSSFSQVAAYYTKDKPVSGGIYSEGMMGKFLRINPIYSQTNQDDENAASLIFSGLMKEGKDRALTYDMARKWSLSADQKTYTFELKKGIKWQDGASFGPDDVLFTIGLIQNTDVRSPLYETWKGVKAEKTENGVKFTLNAPDQSFLENTTLKILPKHILEKIPARDIQTVDFNIKPVGTGPFKFVSLDKEQDHETLTLARNEDFYGKKPYLDGVKLESFLYEKDILDAYSRRNVMGIGDPSLTAISELKDKNTNLYEYNIPRYVAVFFNTQSQFLKDKNLRSALSLTVDKKDVLGQAAGGRGLVQNYPVSPGLVAEASDLPKAAVSVGQAKDVLKNAGYTLKGKQLQLNGKDVSLKIVTADSEELSKTADAVAKEFGQLGVKTDVRKVDMTALQQEYLRPRSYDAVILGEDIGAYPDLFSFWHSSQVNDPGLNFSEYKNPELDKYLELEREAANDSDRQARINDIQRIILEDAPAVYLYDPFYYFAASSKIKGMESGKIVSPEDRFWNISDWYLKADKVMIDS